MLLAGHRVAVTTVHPGYVKTAIAWNAEAAPAIDKTKGVEMFEKLAITSPARAARTIFESGV